MLPIAALAPRWSLQKLAARLQGVWIEPGLNGTLFTTHIGEVAASATSTVGLALDKSQGLQLGQELIANGTFPSDIIGWTAFGGASVAWNNGLQITYAVAASGAYQSFSTIVGKWYEATLILSTATAYNQMLRCGDGATPNAGLADSSLYSGPSTKTIRFQATGTTSYVYLRGGSSAVAVFTGVSVKQLNGNHAYQSTAANRPTLQQSGGRYFLRADSTDLLNVTLPALSGGNYSTTASVYLATPTSMTALHEQTIGTSYAIPMQSLDAYGVAIFPQRLGSSDEQQLKKYFEKLAGVQ